MSSYCANNPEKCDKYADALFGTGTEEEPSGEYKEFDALTDEQKAKVCEYCNDDRIAYWDYLYEQEKYKNL